MELFFSERSSTHLQRLQYQLDSGWLQGLPFANQIEDTGNRLKAIFEKRK